MDRSIRRQLSGAPIFPQICSKTGLVSAGQRFAKALLLTAALALPAGCDSATPQQHLDKAQTLTAQGDTSAAIIELKNALKKDPEFAPARAALGDVYLRSGDFPSALKELERAQDLGSNDASARLGLAKAKLSLGRVQEVIGDLSERSDRSLDEDLILAEAYLSAGNVDEAKPLFERGREKAAGMAGLAAIAWNNGNLEQAGEYFAKAVEVEPDNAQIWLRKAELELSRKQYDPARTSFGQAAKQPTGRVLGEIGEVRTLLAEQDLEGASVAIDEVLAIAPNYPLARYLEGLIRYQTGDLANAESALRDVQRQYPDHGPSLYLMGLLKYQQGQLAQAESQLARFLADNENSESARKLLATVQYERGDIEDAIDTLRPIQTATRDPQVLAMLGTAMMRTGKSSEATEYLQRAVELAPDGAAFRNQLALNLLSAGEEEKAEAQLDAAIQTDGAQFQSDYLLAMMQLRQGELNKAKQSVAQIVEKSPASPVGPNLQGAIALSEKRPEDAIAHFRKSLELDPGFSPARNNLIRLLEKQGDVSGAESVLLERITEDGDDLASLLGLADLLARNGRLKDAVGYAQRATLVNADSPRARLALARLLVLTGEEPEALESVSHGLSRDPNNPDLKLLRSELNMRAGNKREAAKDLSELQSMLADRPDNARLAYVLGRMQAQMGNADLARNNFERVIALSEGQNAEALLALGRLNLTEQKYQEVGNQISALKKLKRPAVVGAATLLQADLEMARENPEAAEKLYQALHKEGNREGTLRLAGISLRSGKSDQGIELLEGWLQSNPTDQAARILLSSALMSDDKTEQAISEYEKLVATGNPVVLNNLAWLYMEKGDKRAIGLAERAHNSAPASADIADTYGWILVQNEKYDEAITVLSKSIDLNDKNPTTLYHLGVARYRAGELESARRTLRKALKHDGFPEAEDAKAMLATIGG